MAAKASVERGSAELSNDNDKERGRPGTHSGEGDTELAAGTHDAMELREERERRHRVLPTQGLERRRVVSTREEAPC